MEGGERELNSKCRRVIILVDLLSSLKPQQQISTGQASSFFSFFWLNGGAEEAEVAEMKENPEMKMAEEDTEAHCSTG